MSCEDIWVPANRTTRMVNTGYNDTNICALGCADVTIEKTKEKNFWEMSNNTCVKDKTNSENILRWRKITQSDDCADAFKEANNARSMTCKNIWTAFQDFEKFVVSKIFFDDVIQSERHESYCTQKWRSEMMSNPVQEARGWVCERVQAKHTHAHQASEWNTDLYLEDCILFVQNFRSCPEGKGMMALPLQHLTQCLVVDLPFTVLSLRSNFWKCFCQSIEGSFWKIRKSSNQIHGSLHKIQSQPQMSMIRVHAPENASDSRSKVACEQSGKNLMLSMAVNMHTMLRSTPARQS